MFQKDELCPHCGEKPGNYFFSLDGDEDLDELVILREYDHPAWDSEEGWACRDGCERWTRQKWAFYCEHCGEEVKAEMVYVEPCDSNPYVLEMIWRAE